VSLHYLLDTNAWLRLFNAPKRIEASTLDRLRSEEQLGLSSFSFMEVSQKSCKEKLFQENVGDWFEKATPPGKIIPHPITPDIARMAYRQS
jgi:PIN domain nuclease of toxin-antitoxin system